MFSLIFRIPPVIDYYLYATEVGEVIGMTSLLLNLLKLGFVA